MSLLDTIATKVASGQRHTEEWYVLNNAYFHGETALCDLKQWADSAGIALIIRYKQPAHPLEQVAQSVTFLPRR
jgi:hypothetical protein